MSKHEDVRKSLTTPVDAMSVFAHHLPGVVAAGITGLDQEGHPQEGLTIVSDKGKLIRLSESSAAGAQDGAHPVAGAEDRDRICSYCSFAIHIGRSLLPAIKELCQPCKDECFPEATNA
jgi:hypothetical protein